MARGTPREIAQYITEGFWRDRDDIPRSFDLQNENGDLEVNLGGLNVAGRNFARLALEEWSAVSGIEFTEVQQGADITFSDDVGENEYAQTSWLYSDNGVIASATINIPASVIDSDPAPGDEAHTLYLHEIGHALGLGHPGPYNEVPEGEENANPGSRRFDNDTYLQSVTSYFSPELDDQAETGFARPITPMVADIESMEILYGSTNIRGGNTTYGTANGALSGFDTGMLATIADTGGTDTIDLSNVSASMNLDLSQGAVSTFRGADGGLVIARGSHIENATGSSRADVISGNGADNVLRAAGGGDELFGRSGHDTLAGGGGQDTLWGGSQGDVLRGGNGNDTLNGDKGWDTLYGGVGSDTLDGGGQADELSGNAGSDTLYGNGGGDTLWGGQGGDVLHGQYGDDALNGNKGWDTLYGGVGSDTLDGGNGRDGLYGQGGGDTLYGGGQADELSGNAGSDTLYGNGGGDTLWGGQGGDVLRGQRGNDTLNGDKGWDELYGGGGDDTLDGGGGRDTLYGRGGNDVLSGGDGTDTFVFENFRSGETDTVTDFENGSETMHMVGVNGFGDLTVSDGQGGAEVDYQGHIIILEGLQANQIGSDDFVFV